MFTEAYYAARIIRHQRAADNAFHDLYAAQRDLASSANPCIWRSIFEQRRLLTEAVFFATGDYADCLNGVDPLYEQAFARNR